MLTTPNKRLKYKGRNLANSRSTRKSTRKSTKKIIKGGANKGEEDPMFEVVKAVYDLQEKKRDGVFGPMDSADDKRNTLLNCGRAVKEWSDFTPVADDKKVPHNPDVTEDRLELMLDKNLYKGYYHMMGSQYTFDSNLSIDNVASHLFLTIPAARNNVKGGFRVVNYYVEKKLPKQTVTWLNDSTNVLGALALALKVRFTNDYHFGETTDNNYEVISYPAATPHRGHPIPAECGDIGRNFVYTKIVKDGQNFTIKKIVYTVPFGYGLTSPWGLSARKTAPAMVEAWKLQEYCDFMFLKEILNGNGRAWLHDGGSNTPKDVKGPLLRFEKGGEEKDMRDREPAQLELVVKVMDGVEGGITPEINQDDNVLDVSIPEINQDDNVLAAPDPEIQMVSLSELGGESQYQEPGWVDEFIRLTGTAAVNQYGWRWTVVMKENISKETWTLMPKKWPDIIKFWNSKFDQHLGLQNQVTPQEKGMKSRATITQSWLVEKHGEWTLFEKMNFNRGLFYFALFSQEEQFRLPQDPDTYWKNVSNRTNVVSKLNALYDNKGPRFKWRFMADVYFVDRLLDQKGYELSRFQEEELHAELTDMTRGLFPPPTEKDAIKLYLEHIEHLVAQGWEFFKKVSSNIPAADRYFSPGDMTLTLRTKVIDLLMNKVGLTNIQSDSLAQRRGDRRNNNLILALSNTELDFYDHEMPFTPLKKGDRKWKGVAKVGRHFGRCKGPMHPKPIILVKDSVTHCRSCGKIWCRKCAPFFVSPRIPGEDPIKLEVNKEPICFDCFTGKSIQADVKYQSTEKNATHQTPLEIMFENSNEAQKGDVSWWWDEIRLHLLLRNKRLKAELDLSDELNTGGTKDEIKDNQKLIKKK